MGFLNPAMLWATLAVILPVLIHLLNRYRHKELDWAAMELLRRALVVRARQIRLEDILILLLRCLAVLLIALAMARPTLMASGAKWFGAEAQVGVVIAIDASYSMAHRPGVNTRFDRALARVREILKTLDPGNPLSLVVMGSSPRILLRNVVYDETRLEKVLKETAPLPERLNLELCLEELENLVREIRAPMRECYLVTDAQATTWEEISDKAKLSLQEMNTVARVFLLSVASENAENLAITGFSLASGTLRKGTMARFVAEVRNVGRQPQEKAALSLVLNGRPVDQRVVDRIPPGQVASVPVFTRFDTTGNSKLTVQLGPDPLPEDNIRHAVAYVRDEVRVLCVDGEPSDKPYEGETGYLETALAPKRGPAGQSLVVKAIPWLALSTQRLADYQVVILANVPDIRAAQAAALHTYVAQGGGLIVFLGGKIIPRLVNAHMAHGGKTLLPARIVELANPSAGRRGDGAPEAESVAMEVVMAGHPVAGALAGLPAELLNAARFTQYFKVALLPGGRTILKFVGTEDPFLAEKSLGRGRVLLFTSTADRAWTNLVVNPIYPILLHQAVTYLSRQEHEQAFTVGEALSLTLPRRTIQSNVLFRDPTGKDSPIQVTERDGQRVVTFEKPEWPGFYEARYAAGTPPLVAAVNVDPTESDVKSLIGRALPAAFKGLPVRLAAWGDDIAVAIRASRVGHELWRVLLIVGLAVLALESFLAHRFSRRIAGAGSAREVTREDLLGPRPAPEART